jgi:hypothetical protein
MEKGWWQENRNLIPYRKDSSFRDPSTCIQYIAMENFTKAEWLVSTFLLQFIGIPISWTVSFSIFSYSDTIYCEDGGGAHCGRDIQMLFRSVRLWARKPRVIIQNGRSDLPARFGAPEPSPKSHASDRHNKSASLHGILFSQSYGRIPFTGRVSTK